ncbi:MAG TPA: UDP-galactopyranose mutase, partial [Sphingomicrobium sp.]
MSRFARDMKVIFWEEPTTIGARETAYLQVREAANSPNVRVVVPHLPEGMPEEAREATLKRLLDAHVASVRGPLVAWYYTPMMLPFSRDIQPDLTVFDAMDELSKFKFAPAKLLELEQELIDRADIVFTGGSSLYEAKKDRHANVHCFPSSVDRAHFFKARAELFDPADQEDLPRPRLGFYGVIDERFDTELLDRIAEMRPS